jgi:hypothetical protein
MNCIVGAVVYQSCIILNLLMHVIDTSMVHIQIIFAVVYRVTRCFRFLSRLEKNDKAKRGFIWHAENWRW